MKVVIDRFEGPFAVCEKESKKMIDIKKMKLPKDAKEGDVLNIQNGEISIDVAETKKRKNVIENLTKDLWN